MVSLKNGTLVIYQQPLIYYATLWLSPIILSVSGWKKLFNIFNVRVSRVLAKVNSEV